jgi:hypothetical protein
MRLYVVYDDRGTILAAAKVPAEVRGSLEAGEPGPQFDMPLSERAPSGPQFDMPLPELGEHASAFEVPAEFAERDLNELVPQLHVNVREKRLVEKDKV